VRRISIFGSTGSIGQNTIDLIARAPDSYSVVSLTGGRNVELLAHDARRLSAKRAVTCFPECYSDLKDLLAGSGVEVAAGPDAVTEAADDPVDWAMSAIVGAAGLPPGLTALKHGTTLALANKESLVTAGPLLMETARSHGARILPVDSEHSAVFQALVGEDTTAVEKVVITASGGAFRDWSMDQIAKATVAQASSHPNWNMGQRITIDSASMFNKAMELIETHEFFGFAPNQIETVIHRESLVHALVGFRDGAIMAHLGPSDMRHAIGYALHWPERKDLPVERLDLALIGQLSFAVADPDRYPALGLARQVMEHGGLSGAVFNAAKEAALDAFIAGRIGFLDMARVVDAVLNTISPVKGPENATVTLEQVTQADAAARRAAGEEINRLG
jgi:1-deoxy-D-xylulose-5-phosphate reductoisomerase